MARKEKEININRVKIRFTGTEEQFKKFLQTVVFEYLTENVIEEKDEIDKSSK